MSSYYEKILATGEVNCIDEEVPFEIPATWNWARLSNITSILGDGIHGTPEYDATGTVYFINGNNLSNGSIEIKADTKKVSEQEAEKHKRLLNSTTVLVSINGTLGNVAFYNGENVILGKSACYFNLMGNIDKQYIKHILETEYFTEYAKNVATGSTIKNVPLAGMRNFLIPVPPITEQHRIIQGMVRLAHSIVRYNDAQTKLDLLNNILNEKLKKSVLQEAIQGKLVPQIASEGTAHELLEQIKIEKQELVKEGKLKKSALNDSVIFRGDDNKYWEKKENNVVCIDDEIPFVIPNSWNWCRLKDIGRTETGTTPSKSHPEYFGNYIPFLSPANILGSKIISETQGLSNIGIEFGRVVPKNSILQVCIGGSIGKCAIVNKPATFNQQINSITPYLCNVEFVHIVLQSEYFRLAIMDKATGTATPIINRGNWETLLFPLPPLKEQLRIIEKYKGVTSIMSR